MSFLPKFPNQGQKIAPNWDNAATLKDITAYVGTDGLKFLPVEDRGGYTNGVDRNMGTGGNLQSGMPIARWTSPWMSDGQLYYLKNTLLSGLESGNVTIATHIPTSIGAQTVSNFNAVFNLNLNQLQGLTRKRNGYLDFVWTLVIVESL